jgi:hypothetical protein
MTRPAAHKLASSLGEGAPYPGIRRTIGRQASDGSFSQYRASRRSGRLAHIADFFRAW